ncbi:DUF3313 family protein [Altererythrobacter sp. Root672]|uniref:DUF3313 family protein n=1 Tax=Altererythrobacter sp. Root672 TaxID=1736584 RepID=UPI0006F6967A|nr:DUF3313 family protein [Altererythrobacter sp. Root672]KRA84650.1 hypothetical protein ASD76_06475 [Altererythrobacter sp. Root672]
MKHSLIAAVAALALLGSAPVLGQVNENQWENLVRVKSDKIDMVYLAPGADFRPYTKVMFAKPHLAMRANWIRDQRRNSSQGLRISESFVRDALDKATVEFEAIFKQAFTDAGYTIVTTPGPDVLELVTGAIDIDVTAPDAPTAGRTRVYSQEAGAATIVIEARDSMTGAVLGRAIERRLAGDNGPWIRNRVTNRHDFEQIFRRWAEASANGLAELKQLSPVDTEGKALAR